MISKKLLNQIGKITFWTVTECYKKNSDEYGIAFSVCEKKHNIS